MLDKFATKVYFRLVQEKVTGLKDNVEFIESLEQLFVDLDQMSIIVEEELEIKDPLSTTSRALQLQQKCVKQNKTIRYKISQLKNMANLDKLSGHMQSNLMRNLGSGISDIGLMKRYARTDGAKRSSSDDA